ncbi:ABC transporter permease [Halobacillus sp. HZG1]|uniref:ABC transporter permease n=1 Tax=Halobacillus sp. HZG1 TaxID=3111769 RepID=UPI002DB79369|nr:ABC transporter permease [Halobacillus sp. HZG1]MEC3885148.1 ABC transporter permease [Halobacillus sp. HZG1]
MQWLAIAKKDLRVMIKDPGAVVVLFMLPLMLMTIMSFALMPVFQGGDEGTIILPVVDNDKSEDSMKFIDSLESTEGIEVLVGDEAVTESVVREQVSGGEYPYALVIQEDFGNKIDSGKDLEIISYEDPAQANMSSIINRAIEGVSQAFEVEYIVSRMVDEQVSDINQMFTEEIEEVELAYENQIETITEQANIKDPINEVSATTDESNSPDLGNMKEELVETAKSSFDNPSITIETFSATENERVERPNAFEQNVPGYTVMYAFFIIMFAGRSFINERNDGTFRRILAAPVDKWQLFMGKMIPNYIIGIIQVVVLFGFGNIVFDMSLGSSFLGLLIVTLSLVWSSSCLGMLIAATFKTDSQISGWSVLLALTLAALGGTMVPLFIMPEIMQNIALITPHAWALTGYQNLLVRGLGFQDVLLHSMVLGAFGLFFLIISLWRMNFDK